MTDLPTPPPAKGKHIPSRPVIAVSGDKGGVGKSFAARTIASWLVSAGHAFQAVDADSRNAHLERFMGKSVARLPLRSADGWTALYDLCQRTAPTASVLIDLPGNIGDAIDEEGERFGRMMAALGRAVILVWVADEEEDSIWLLQRAQSMALADATLFMMNGRFGSDAEKFELWQGSKTRKAFIAAGGHETVLPALSIHTRTAINRARVPFHDHAAAQLTLTQRVDFDMWWEEVGRALRPLARMMEAL